MKLAIDLQARQTAGSGERGIGRYSLELAKGLVRNRGAHRIHFLLNAAFAWNEGDARSEIAPDSPGVTFESYRLLSAQSDEHQCVSKIAAINDEVVNWRYACTGADALHVSSMFEGWQANDAHVSSKLADVPVSIRTATIYDVIPHLFSDLYLPDDVTRRLYYARLALFHQLDLLFAISECTRRDAINTLGILPDRVVNIGAATSDVFRHLNEISNSSREELRRRHGVRESFILYVGGMDPRKNNDQLFRAYARLPANVRKQFQLVVVCAIECAERRSLDERLQSLDIANDVALTGYVSDADLNLLYNCCSLFVFPSLYEGFGLPVLEAMACGACVIASNAPNLPEIVDRPDVLFDAADVDSLVRKMNELLGSPDRRRALAEWNLVRARDFSWDRTARTMLVALEEAMAHRLRSSTAGTAPSRSRIALVSPLPPERSGIAGYCESMLPYWSRHFDIDIVADDRVVGTNPLAERYPIVPVSRFRRGELRYDAIVYHFGNSQFHTQMYDLLPLRPGVVVMHDFFLSGLMYWLDAIVGNRGLLSRGVVASHGSAGARDVVAVEQGALAIADLVWTYPVSLKIFKHARGVIFHSRSARDLLASYHPDLADIPTSVIPQATVPIAIDEVERATARTALGIREGELLVCIFGFVVETKGADSILAAFGDADFTEAPWARVVFVGEVPDASLRARLEQILASHPMRERIAITGYVDDETYRRYLAACDVAVSLRTRSRGETSAAMLKQLAAARATIVSDYAAMSELPDDIVIKVQPGDPGSLPRAMKLLLHDADLRAAIGERARRWTMANCHPAHVAERYARCIPVLLARDRAQRADRLIRRVARLVNGDGDAGIVAAASEAISSGIAGNPVAARWLTASPY